MLTIGIVKATITRSIRARGPAWLFSHFVDFHGDPATIESKNQTTVEDFTVKLITLILFALLVVGCSTTPATIQQGPDAEVSFDGLHKVDNSIFAQAWADPDIDFSRYDKVMGGGAFFEFRAVRETSTTSSLRRGSATEFYIPDSDRERLEQEVTAIFQEEMANSTRFEVTEEKGEDVLMLRGGLHDIISRVPPDIIGRSEIYLSSVGEATLVLEIADSMTSEVIFRAVERRAAQRTGTAVRANTVTTWAEVRRLARRWATSLRDGLDSIPAQ